MAKKIGKVVENIIKIRKALNISQEELALIAEVSRQTVSKWETGECQPSMKSVNSISTGLQISATTLLSDNEIDIPAIQQAYIERKRREAQEEQNKKDKENNAGLEENKGIETYIAPGENISCKQDENSNKINDGRTPVVNNNENSENENSESEVVENKKNVIEGVIDKLSSNANDDKARKILIKIIKLFKLIIIISLIIYATLSTYKFIILSKLIKKIEGLNNIENYYAEIVEYSDTIIKEKDYIWYKDGIYKINKIIYDDVGMENENLLLWVDSKQKIRYFYDSDKKELKKEEIQNIEIYNGMKYVLNYMPQAYRKIEKYMIKNTLNPLFKIKNSKLFIILENKNTKVNYRKNDGIPYSFYTIEKNKETIKDYNVTLNCVTNNDIKIAYN